MFFTKKIKISRMAQILVCREEIYSGLGSQIKGAEIACNPLNSKFMKNSDDLLGIQEFVKEDHFWDLILNLNAEAFRIAQTQASNPANNSPQHHEAFLKFASEIIIQYRKDNFQYEPSDKIKPYLSTYTLEIVDMQNINHLKLLNVVDFYSKMKVKKSVAKKILSAEISYSIIRIFDSMTEFYLSQMNDGKLIPE